MRSGSAKGGARRSDEEAIHRAVVDALTRAGVPGVAWTHMPAGEARAPAVAGKLKGMGVKPGWPDLLLVSAGRLYGLELKTLSGRLSPAQVAAHATLRAAGAEVAVTYGLDQALGQLAAWGALRLSGQARSPPAAENEEPRRWPPPGLGSSR